MRPSVCVYEKVRDKLGEMCGEVVMIFVCVCVCMFPGVYGAICTHDLSQERQSSSTVGLWHAFSGCVVRAISINVFMIFIYLNIFIRG